MEKIRVNELDMVDERKKSLVKLLEPKTTAQLAAELNLSYSAVSQMLQVWHARGLVTRIRSGKNRVLYKLNLEIVEL